MALSFEDRVLGEKAQNYCSSSEDEGERDDEPHRADSRTTATTTSESPSPPPPPVSPPEMGARELCSILKWMCVCVCKSGWRGASASIFINLF